MHLLELLGIRRKPPVKVRTDCPDFVAIACCDGKVSPVTGDGICHDGSTSDPRGVMRRMVASGCRRGHVITVVPGSDVSCTDHVALFQ